MKLWIFILCIFLFTGFSISDHCLANDNESVLQPKHEYWYHFKTEAFGEAVGTTNDRSRMTLDCTVHISHTHECTYYLKMHDCSLSAIGGPPDSESAWIDKKEITDLSKYPVMFTLSNGEIKDIYAEENDPLFFVNIKRGALSAFVFKLSAVEIEMNDEHVDIHGTCPWHSIPMDGKKGFVKASKNMLYCAFPSRPDWQFSPWSAFWNMSFIQYQINSTFDCEYKVSGNILENVYCKERHAIGLESTHRTTTAVQTNIYYHMTYEKSSKTSSDATYSLPSRQTSIIFEYNKTPDPTEESEPQDFLPKAEQMLLELVETSQEEIQLLTIPKFTDFVAWMRASHNLLPFVDNVKTCVFLRNHLTCDDNIKELSMAYLSDALIQCNTVPCFEAVSKLAVDGDLSDMYLNFVLYSWNNMHFTKPAIIPHVKAICEAKDSKFCWLVLGKMIQNYRGTESLYQHPVELKNVATHFHENVMTQCHDSLRSSVGNEEKYDRLLTDLKALTNIGTIYTAYYPSGALELLSCVRKATFPMPIRIAAVEALSVCKDVPNEKHPGYEGCQHLYRILSEMFFDSSVDVSLRLVAYDRIMEQPEMWFFMELPNIFSKENNTQILSYVASNLNHQLNNALFKKKFPIFVSKINHSLDKKRIYLERYINYDESKSKSKAFGNFFDFSFLPVEMQGFGAKFTESVIFPVYNMLPQSFRASTNVQFFNKAIQLMQANLNIEGFHEFQPLIHKIIQEMHGSPISSNLIKRIFEIVQAYISDPHHSNAPSYENYPFDKVVMDNIEKLHNLFQQHKSTSKSSFNFYLDMLGSTLNMFTSKDLKSLPSLKETIALFLKKLMEGVTYNHTRVIRIIEAYHQVPTMMGLPLNWTTNATLAFSSRKHLQLSFGQNAMDTQIQGHGHFQPSMALTFLNRMVLDFPTFTQIGVQANSSGFTSTQWAAHLHHPAEAHNMTRFSIDVPEKSQKLLQLFRTNQLIKHDNYNDIPDWDIERTSASWCSSESFSSAIGLQVCHQRSYPNVTHLIKPWALMAGWCKWTLELKPYDKHLKSYNFKMIRGKLGDEIQTAITLNGPGSMYKREISIVASQKPDFTVFDLAIKTMELPLYFTLSHHRVDDKTTSASLQFTDELEYKMIYSNGAEIIEQDHEEVSNTNKAPKSKNVKIAIKEVSFALETPYNNYRYTQKMNMRGRNMKMEAFALFESHKPEWNWLSSIFPPVLWETSNKSWLRLRLNSRGTSPKSLTCDVESPKSTIRLASNSLSMPGRKHFNVNVTKVDASNQLLSFANFTYNTWVSANDNIKEVSVWNFTIPKRSWSLRERTIVEDIGKGSYDALLTIAQLNPKAHYDQNYVGWWSSDVEENFVLSVREFNLKTDIDVKKMKSSEIMEIVPSWPASDNWNEENNFIKTTVSFLYPTSYKQESATFDGYFIVTNTPKVSKFQKDFALISSYHNLRLDSHSVYHAVKGQRKLTHFSFFTHSGSESQAFYKLDYSEVHHEDSGIPCYDIDFNHNISSHVLNFASNLSYHCDHFSPGNALNEVFTLNLDSSSLMWDMLNTKLRQRIEGTPKSKYETMNFTHPLMNINVVAEWRGSSFSKNAIFTKTSDNSPVMILNLKAKIPTTSSVVIDVFNENKQKTQMIYERFVSTDFKEITFNTYYPDKQHKINKLQGVIVNPHKRIWTYEAHPNTTDLRELLSQFEKKVIDMTTKIANDPDHPLNQILKPALKMPLSQYWSSLKRNVFSSAFSAWNDVKYAFIQLLPLYETPLRITFNIFSTIFGQIKHLYKLAENKSITIWTIKYFQLPALFQRGLMHLSQGLQMFKNIFVLPNDVHKYVFHHTGEFLKWKSFIKFPEFSFRKSDSLSKSDNVKLYHRFAKSKIGAIFGPRHVYTFDGHVYEFPTYPSNDCVYLLAHDLHRDRFSILSTADSIHILFPEMAININAMGQLLINGSQASSLPIQSTNRDILVQKEGEIFKVVSPLVIILCDTRNEFCTIELNAWNGGATLGLLGNADGEVYNEYMVPDGSVKTNVAEFAKYYEMTGKPECQNLEPNSQPSQRIKNQCGKELDGICDSLFNKQDGFINSCAIDINERGTACPTKMALSALCSLEDEIMPAECNVQKQESEHIRHRLEVIFVVDEHKSVVGDSKGIFLKGMESLVTAIDKKFQDNGYSTIAYCLIGFGGSGVHFHPSVHTVKNDLWVPVKSTVNDLLKTLNFEGSIKGHAVHALRYALEVLGHNTFDSKMIIFITNEDQQIATKELLHLTQNYLDKNSITLYTLASYPTIEKGKKVFGVRADGLIFPSPSKDGEAYLDYPRGDLAKLTSATKGSLFFKNFLDSNAPSNFFVEVAQEMWAKIHKEVKFCRKCTTIRRWWYYYNQCVIKDCSE